MAGTGPGRTIDQTLSVRDGHLWVDEVDVVDIARVHGTPVYVLSERRLRANAAAYRTAFGNAWPHGDVRVLPSLKANPSTAVARILASEGLGCDVFGPSEFRLAIAGGFEPELVSLNGSIKDPELIEAAVGAGVRITLDSAAELDRAIDAASRTGRRAAIRLRTRPDYSGLDLPTDFVEEPVPMSEAARRYKAGIPTDELLETGRRALAEPAIDLRGLMVHLPRHRTEVEVWAAAAQRFTDVVALASDAWGGWRPSELDLGGGLPSRRDPTGGLIGRRATEERAAVASTAEYATAIAGALASRLRDHGVDPAGIALEIEPGRALFADAGIHLGTVRHVKRETEPTPWTWIETDTSEVFLLDVLIEHNLWQVVAAGRMDDPAHEVADVVGRSCGFDLIVPDAHLPALADGDLLAFLDTGAYQDASATNFNAMPRPATVLVSGDRVDLIKRAETVDDVFARDIVPTRLGDGP